MPNSHPKLVSILQKFNIIMSITITASAHCLCNAHIIYHMFCEFGKIFILIHYVPRTPDRTRTCQPSTLRWPCYLYTILRVLFLSASTLWDLPLTKTLLNRLTTSIEYVLPFQETYFFVYRC